MAKRIVLVGPLPPPAGGMANQTAQLAGLLKADGYSVTTVACNRAYQPGFVANLRFIRSIFRLVPYVGDLWKSLRDAPVVHVMANSGWSWYLFAAPAILVARIRNVPVVLNYRGGHAADFLSGNARLVRPLIRKCRQLLVPSVYLQGVFADYGISAKVIPNVVDRSRFFPANKERWLENLVRGEVQIAVTRNLEPIYDIETAVRAFHCLLHWYPRARLRIAGSGSSRESVEKLIEKLGIAGQVSREGPLRPDEVARLYRECHVFLNTSQVDNAPNAILEACASGLPVVSTGAGGIPDLVRAGEQALLGPVGEPEAIAKIMRSLIADTELACRLRDNGLKLAARHDWSVIGKQLAECYFPQGTEFEQRWRGRFERFAETHDDDAGIAGWSAGGLASRLRQFSRSWVRAAAPGGTWLDAGCGAGTYSRWLAQRGVEVVALDYSMVTIEKAIVRSQEVSGWCLGDVRRLPLPNAVLDGVISFGVTQTLNQPQQLVPEFGRVVRNGGQVWLDGLNRNFLPHLIIRLLRRLSGKGVHLHYVSAGSIVNVFRSNGYRDIYLEWLPLAPSRFEFLQKVLESGPMSVLFRYVPGFGALFSHSFIVRATVC